MLKVFFVLIFAAAAVSQNDPASDKSVDFKKKHPNPIGVLTTSAGVPVEYQDATSTVNSNLLTNQFFLESVTHFVRERIPERVVHGPGTGALGYFEVTQDISNICKAKLFSKVGKKTPIAVRFSSALQRVGASDTARDIKGMAVKCYTEEGIFDLIGVNTPVFPALDPLVFLSAVHAARGNPATNMPDGNALWDVITKHPETFYAFMYMFSDYGAPDGYAHMSGYPLHLYEVYNKKGKKSYLKFHMLPDAGTKNLNTTQLQQVAADPNYYARGLYNSIANGEYPSWQLKAQILTEEDVSKLGSAAYDVTRTLPLKNYTLHTIGKFTLTENPFNYFAQMEQIAFSPANRVPGILGSADKQYETRCLVYNDAHNYRLGGNYNNILINCPMGVKTLTLNRDGQPPVNTNGKDAPNYYPNSYNGQEAYVDKNKPNLSKIIQEAPNNLKDAGDFYANVLNSNEQTSLVQNLVAGICSCEADIKKRVIKLFTSINEDFGEKVAQGLDQCGN